MSVRSCYLAIDFGTSNVHVSLVDRDTTEFVVNTGKKYGWYSPREDRIELDAEEIWEASVAAVGEAVMKAQGKAEIAAITFTFFGDNITPVDSDGNAIYPMIPGFCGRSAAEVQTFEERIGSARHGEITGNTLTTMSSASKILWLRNNEPEVFKKAAGFYSNQQYIMHKLGFGNIQDRTLAARKLAMDMQLDDWSEPILEVCEVTKEQMGERIVESQTVVGKITHYGDVDLGREVPVTIGCHDVSATLLGAGVPVDRVNTLGVLMGTFEQIGYFSDKFVPGTADFSDSLIFACCYSSPFAGKYTVMDAFPTAGAMLEWYCKYMLRDPNADIGKLIAEADLEKKSRVFFLPYAENYHGAIVGMGLSTTLEEIFAALLKSLAYQFVACIDYIKSTTTGTFETIRFGGGGSRSNKLISLRADLLGAPVERMENVELPTLGACVLASLGNGWADSVAQAQSQIRNNPIPFNPNAARREQEQADLAYYRSLSADYLRNH